MIATETLVVGRIEANAGGVSLEGEIRREGRGYVYAIAGQARGQAPRLGAAAQRLGAALRGDLPRHPQGDWGVAVHCLTRGDVGLLYGNRAGGGRGGGGAPNPCVLAAQRAYARGDNNLARALESAARVLADCCG